MKVYSLDSVFANDAGLEALGIRLQLLEEFTWKDAGCCPCGIFFSF